MSAPREHNNETGSCPPRVSLLLNAAQNAIDPDLFPVFRAESAVQVLQARNALRAMSGRITDNERRELADAYRTRDSLLKTAGR